MPVILAVSLNDKLEIDKSIQLVADYLGYKASREQIVASLKSRGMTDHDIYLVYTAGKLLYKARINLYGEIE